MTKSKKQNKRKKRNLILLIVILVPVLCLLAVYSVGAGYYQNRFLRGTVIDGVDVSNMSISQLEEQTRKYALRVLERQADGTILEEEITGRDIGFSYVSTEPLKAILQGQNSFLWFLKQDASYETVDLFTYNEDALKERIGGLRGFKEDFVSRPTDAYISDYVPGQGFELVAESQGNSLDRNKTMEAVKGAVDKMEGEVDLAQAGCYEEPKVTTEDAGLKDTYAKLQNYVNVVITYTFGAEKEVLDGDTIVDWISVDGTQVNFDQDKVKEYVNSLRKKYDTIFHTRKFQTSYETEVTIDRGDYGWWMDTETETEELTQMLERGESGERVPVYRQKAASFDSPDYGDSYVEINLTAQHLFLYQNGECVLESDFVSGNPSRGNATPTGIYGITYKERDATLKGENYRTPVSFWMPFNNNVGMHDATWRSEFGGNIYMSNGSHGCINLPYSIAEEIYGQVEKDTPVICYLLPGTEQAPLPQETTEPEAGETGAESSEGTIGAPETETAGDAAAAPETESPETATVVPETE